MLKPRARRRLGPAFEVLLILLGLGLLYQIPLAWTSDLWFVFALGVPLMAVMIVFPVTLPSMLVSLELVFTFYFVMTHDIATTLWVNFLGELVGALLLAKHTRKEIILLNPVLKVLCLAAGYGAFALVEQMFFASEATSGYAAAKLFLIGTVFFLANHLILNTAIWLRTQHFNLASALEAFKWELVVYLIIFPLAYIAYMVYPILHEGTLLLLTVPVGVLNYLLRLFNRLQWSNRVNMSCIELSTTKDMSSICQRTFRIAQEMTDSPKAMLLRKIGDNVYQGLDSDDLFYDRISHPMLDEVAATQQAMTIKDSRLADNLFPQWHARSMVLLPLMGKTKVFGIICLGKMSTHGFYKSHHAQLHFLAHQVSIILDRNHVYEELERAAVTNKLTGLYNYHYFNEKLDEEFRLAKGTGRELSLIIFDIDHFKKYNDTYGHLVGDEVLRQVSQVAKKVCDSHGLLLARYGGEEFVAFGELKVQEAYVLADEIRRRVEEHQFVYQEHTVKNLTISCGIADVEEHDATSPSDLMEKADQALYWGAKEMGRNRVAVFGAEFDQRLFVDTLTGLHTMYYLRRKLSSVKANEANFPLHFLLVNIRGMRKINDDYGYEVGNRVLVETSYLLKNALRTDDVICRYMDDEFLIMVKGIPEIDGVSQRIRDAFHSHLFPIVGSTVSCEVTAVTMCDAEEAEHIVEWLQSTRKQAAKFGA